MQERREQTAAAVKIQGIHRQKSARAQVQERREQTAVAVKMQGVKRQRDARAKVQERREQTAAATKIANVRRSRVARQRVLDRSIVRDMFRVLSSARASNLPPPPAAEAAGADGDALPPPSSMPGVIDKLDLLVFLHHGGGGGGDPGGGGDRAADRERVLSLIREQERLRPLLVPATAVRLFEAMDANSDGHVTFEEFTAFLEGDGGKLLAGGVDDEAGGAPAAASAQKGALIAVHVAPAAAADGVASDAADAADPPGAADVGEILRERVRDLFHALDTDSNGVLDKVELLQGLRDLEGGMAARLREHEALAPLLRPSTFLAAFLHLDTERTGCITPAEFEAFCFGAAM